MRKRLVYTGESVSGRVPFLSWLLRTPRLSFTVRFAKGDVSFRHEVWDGPKKGERKERAALGKPFGVLLKGNKWMGQ